MIRSVTVVLISAVVLLSAACGNGAYADQQSGSPSGGQQSVRPSSQHPRTTEEDRMRLRITIGDQHFQATLDDSAAARDLAAQLPLTVEMSDHGAVEKTGPLPAPLSLDGQPAGADPDVGDVGYYAPGNNLVLYYGDQSYYDGIVVLGRLEGDAAERIASMDGSIKVQLQS